MYIEFTILNHIIPNTNLWCPVCKFLAMSSWHTDCESLPRYHPDRVFLNYLPPPGSSRLKPGMIFSLNFPGSRTSDVIWTQVNYSNVFNRRFKQLWSSDWTINLNVQPSTMNPILLAPCHFHLKSFGLIGSRSRGKYVEGVGCCAVVQTASQALTAPSPVSSAWQLPDTPSSPHPSTYHISTQPPSTFPPSHPMAWCPLILSPH